MSRTALEEITLEMARKFAADEVRRLKHDVRFWDSELKRCLGFTGEHWKDSTNEARDMLKKERAQLKRWRKLKKELG